MSACLLCGGNVARVIPLGRMPVANGFLAEHEFAAERFFDLTVGFCGPCNMVQLVDPVDPSELFHGNYPFYTASSAFMVRHFAALAESLRSRYLQGGGAVVELGSNDGTFLRNFIPHGIGHLGIEPSSNVAQAARDGGVDTWCEFFNEALAQRIVAQRGHADVVVGANVMCHITDIHSVARGVKTLLSPRGVLVFEDPYLGDIVEKCAYDQFYDEHVWYFSLCSVVRLFEPHGLVVVDAEPLGTHGGSMRYTLAHKGARPVSDGVTQRLAHERQQGLDQAETFLKMHERIQQSRSALVALLRQLKADGKRVAGYGATSKSTTVLNYCGIGQDLVEYISDTTPLKIGKFTPGTHIPVRAHKQFAADHPDHAVLFAWNHEKEIVAKEQQFVAGGGRWVRFVPRVEVVS